MVGFGKECEARLNFSIQIMNIFLQVNKNKTIVEKMFPAYNYKPT